jgi:hypothetical protein
MSTAHVLVRHKSWADFIARLGSTLSELEAAGDGVSWERFRTIIAADAEARAHPDTRPLWGDLIGTNMAMTSFTWVRNEASSPSSHHFEEQ